MAVGGSPGPRSVVNVVDYIPTLAVLGAGRSALDRAVNALNFIELAGGVPPELQLAVGFVVRSGHSM